MSSCAFQGVRMEQWEPIILFIKLCDVKCAQPRHECCVVNLIAMIEKCFEHRATSWNEPETYHAGHDVATHGPQTSQAHRAICKQHRFQEA
eukprot:1414515-Heterocapsa_arctica.AAC.1